MDDSVASAIVAGGLDPATCVPSIAGASVWRIEVPADQKALATWVAIAKVAKQDQSVADPPWRCGRPSPSR